MSNHTNIARCKSPAGDGGHQPRTAGNTGDQVSPRRTSVRLPLTRRDLLKPGSRFWLGIENLRQSKRLTAKPPMYPKNHPSTVEPKVVDNKTEEQPLNTTSNEDNNQTGLIETINRDTSEALVRRISTRSQVYHRNFSRLNKRLRRGPRAPQSLRKVPQTIWPVKKLRAPTNRTSSANLEANNSFKK